MPRRAAQIIDKTDDRYSEAEPHPLRGQLPSYVPRRASPASGAITASAPKPVIFSRRSATGSPKASTRRSCKTLGRCSTSWRDAIHSAGKPTNLSVTAPEMRRCIIIWANRFGTVGDRRPVANQDSAPQIYVISVTHLRSTAPQGFLHLGASQSGHANLSSSLSATPRRGSHAVMMPSAFCGVGMPSRRRLASERRKEGEEFNTSHFSGNGDRPLLGHQLDRPSTFGRPRTVAMVDRWRVFFHQPLPIARRRDGDPGAVRP